MVPGPAPPVLETSTQRPTLQPALMDVYWNFLNVRLHHQAYFRQSVSAR